MKKFFIILALAIMTALPSVSMAETYITSALFIGDYQVDLGKQAISAQEKFNLWLKTLKNRNAIISICIGSSASSSTGTYSPVNRELYSILVVYEAQK